MKNVFVNENIVLYNVIRKWYLFIVYVNLCLVIIYVICVYKEMCVVMLKLMNIVINKLR